MQVRVLLTLQNGLSEFKLMGVRLNHSDGSPKYVQKYARTTVNLNSAPCNKTKNNLLKKDNSSKNNK